MNDNLKWFTYRQNNSGGSFDRDDKVDVNVIIQAHSVKEADELAKVIGIYFNGVEKGIDCECCGDRWYGCWDDEGTDEPMVYGEVVKDGEDGVKIHPWGSIRS